jgi:hypothetical protein
MVRNQGRVTRFVVMAMLQAARAEVLGLPRDSAYSWGLNRAIFYAAAKRGFKGGTAAGEAGALPSAEKAATREVYRLGDEEAFRDPKSTELRFVIGDADQTAADFERQIAARFGPPENFRAAWAEAARYVKGFDRATLESRRGFFDDVYRPKRDAFSDDWSERYSPRPKPR